MASTNAQPRSVSGPARHNLVLADPIAFIYLEEDPTVEVVARRETLPGYDIFLVEQWACSRTDPTFIITTFTGDEKSKITVGVLSIPSDERAWSMNLKLYFEGLVKYATKKQETALGTIMVTSLSGFPSSLSVINIPQGDVIANREAFFVNEDLKRLGCSGRVGLTLSAPSNATVAKFYQLYRASDKIPLNSAVVELVKLCQTALIIFGELLPDYADGLLCDVTEEALANWWVEFGAEYYNVEPHDGILGPTTVAALLGTLIGARNRLHAYGAPVGKDVFDIESTKRAIAHFQKSHRMSRTGRLDRQTLARIHRSTAKAASGDGWFVPRAVKSTMAELSGKGGEMVMDMVGAGSKSRIAEVETVDIEQFMLHVQGERAKWLWRGKPKKETVSSPSSATENAALFLTESNVKGSSSLRRTNTTEAPIEPSEEKDRTRRLRHPLERATTIRPADPGRKRERFKDAVGLGNTSKTYKESVVKPEIDTTHNDNASKSGDVASGSSPSSLNRAVSAISPPLTAQTPLNDVPAHKATSVLSDWSEEEFGPSNVAVRANAGGPKDGFETPLPGDTSQSNKSGTPSIAGSAYRGVDLTQLFSHNDVEYARVSSAFRRTQSFTGSESTRVRPNIARWPKHLSFSLAADSILVWDRLEDFNGQTDDDTSALLLDVVTSQHVREHLRNMEAELINWVDLEMHQVEELRAVLIEDQKRLQSTQSSRAAEYRDLQAGAKEVMESERSQLEESAKETEVLGAKLEYEINVLRGKVEDVEDGVGEFERQVHQVEERVFQLESSMEPKEGWWWSRMLQKSDKKRK